MRLLAAGLILVLTLWISKRLSRLAERAIDRMNRGHATDRTLATFISALVRYLAIAVGLIAVLQQLGVQATSIIAVLGAASLAIGLALQGTLGNVAAGVMILLLRPYRAGDVVELNGRQGRVIGMDLFNTKIVDFEGLTLYLPNGKVFSDMIVNISQAGQRRIALVFSVDYEDDLDLAIDTLKAVAAEEPRVLETPEPWAKVTATADSGVEVTLRCWTTTDDWADTQMDLIKQVKERFDQVGLRFPYPHQVHVDREPRQIRIQTDASPEATSADAA